MMGGMGPSSAGGIIKGDENLTQSAGGVNCTGGRKPRGKGESGRIRKKKVVRRGPGGEDCPLPH